MRVQGQHYRTIWVNKDDQRCIQIIDQRALPHQFILEDIRTVQQMASAIQEMHLRGAGLIGAAAGYGMYLAAVHAQNQSDFLGPIQQAAQKLLATRPTAVNLAQAIELQLAALSKASNAKQAVEISFRLAQEIADHDAKSCYEIGQYGLRVIQQIAQQKPGEIVHILTHCNAGWLAFVDYGSATAPIYAAHRAGIPIHVWVDETRPRNQGARLTAWELGQQGIPYTVIADNTGGHLMQQGMVDLLLTGTDRTTYQGDVCNKIGTYLKALAAFDNQIPFYVALPSTTFDWRLASGYSIPIEQRDENEVKYIQGQTTKGLEKVLLTPQDAKAANYAFDVTPARLVTALITERGVCAANQAAITKLFPDKLVIKPS
jgi:methylthioribose-1-phosphate isomerase